MKMENQMNCLLGLRMDISALEKQLKEYGTDIYLVIKQPHTLGTCQCTGLGVNYRECQHCANHNENIFHYEMLEIAIDNAKYDLEDMLMSIWLLANHVIAPDHIVYADDIEAEDLDQQFKKEQMHLKAEAYHRAHAFTDNYDPEREYLISIGKID